MIAQCRRAGAGNIAVIFDRSEGPAQISRWYRAFGAEVIPALRRAKL
jgi:hypothetical protein